MLLVVLEKTLESHLDCKEIQPVHPKGDQSWMFIWRTDCWSWNSQYFDHLMQRADSFEKTLMLGKTEGGRRGRQRMRWLDGITIQHKFEQTPGDSEGQGSLACCSPWGLKELELNWRNRSLLSFVFFVVVAVVFGSASLPTYPTHTSTEFWVCNKWSIIVGLDWAELSRFKLNRVGPTKHSELHSQQ